MARILVVDDRALNREFLATLLGYAGHEVLQANDGADALVLAREQRPDLIITDVLMPNMDGVELADCVHDDPAISDTPIIFYTATYRVPEASVLAESCRVAGVLAKPAEPQTILDAVAAALGTGPAPVLMPEHAAPPSFLGARLPAYLRDLSELQQRLRRMLDEAVEEDGTRHAPQRSDAILSSYQTLGLRMAALLELGLVLSSERDPAKLLDLFCDGAQDIMSCKCTLVAVLDADERRIERWAAHGLSEVARVCLDAFAHAGSAIAEMLADGKPRRMSGRDAASIGLVDLVAEDAAVLLVPTPVRSTASVRGWLCFGDRIGAGAFDEEDEQFSMTLAAQLTLAYGNLVMYDEIQRHAGKLEIEIVERRRAQNELAHRISHDQTTGLPRFALIEEHLQLSLAEAAMRPGEVLVCYVDIDRFHAVNETRGRAVADHVLRTFADRLGELIDGHGRLAHVAADEFAIVLEETHPAFDTLAFGEAIRAAAEKPVTDGQEKIYVTCSVGVSAFPENGRNPLELLRQAEAAMMRAKTAGRNAVRAFSNDQKQGLQDRISLGPQLRHAIADGQLVLCYQPIVDGRDWRIVGFEALVRWESPDFGTLTPDRFLQVAEDLGLIVDIDNYVLESASRQARAWLDEGVGDFSIAVNVSASHMQRADFVDHVRAALEGWNLPARCIELELTENMTADNVERMIGTMQALKTIGVRLSLDDFGTGYSSLNYLRRFPIDTLKIDRSFVHDIATDAGAANICRSVITMGHELGMLVLAEGVEAPEQIDYLHRNGCDAYQGFWFGKPVPPAEAEQLLRHRDLAERMRDVIGPFAKTASR